MDSDAAPSAPSPIDRVLGAPVVHHALSRLPVVVRILGYHDIGDPTAFEAQVRHIVRNYTPVNGAQVASAFRRGARLPRRAAWLTFDDGRPDVVEVGLPILERYDVPATLFVCPGLIEGGRGLWTHEVRSSSTSATVDGISLSGSALVSKLKRMPDRARRAIVAGLVPGPVDPAFGSVTIDQLRRWVASGREVGNHTWDHPVLDQCTPAEQADQIERADDWLHQELGQPVRLFAYPNGDWTAHAAKVLERRGYDIAPLFDHRLTRTSQDPFALSRLRLDAFAPLPRARAILAGGHSLAFGAAARLRG